MDFGESKCLANRNSSTKFIENDNKTSSYVEQFSCTLLGENKNKSDLKLKISKLEAYSRQLCMNLLDLQKNREDITNKTLALSAELDLTENEAEAICSERNVDFLLEAKNKSGCCSICKGEIDNDVANEWHEEEADDDLREPLDMSFLEADIDASECCCCMCLQNRQSYDYLCEKCSSNPESNFGSNSTSNIFPRYENVQYAQTMGQGDTNFCCICSNFEEPSFDRCYKMCACEQHDGAEERFRGGVDYKETSQQLIRNNFSYFMEIEGNSRLNETFGSCVTPKSQDSLSASPSCSSQCKLIKSSAKMDGEVEKNCDSSEKTSGHEKKSKIELIKKVVAPPPEQKNVSALRSKNEIFDANIEDHSRMRINGLKRSGYLQYLETTKSSVPSGEKKIEEQKNCKGDLVMGLLVLFLIILSRAFRSPDLNSLIIQLNHFSTYLYEILDLSKNQRISSLLEILHREFLNFRNSLNFLTNYFTFLGALFGSISFLKTTCSLVKNLYFFLRKGSYDCYPYFSVRKFLKLLKRFLRHLIICTKSQFHFFSYVSYLTLGFLIARVSKITDHSFLQSPKSTRQNYFLESKWW